MFRVPCAGSVGRLLVGRAVHAPFLCKRPRGQAGAVTGNVRACAVSMPSRVVGEGPVTDERVVLLIRSLDVGGAERQVVELAIGLHRRGVPVAVLTFYDGGALATDLERAGVRRCSAGKGGRWDAVRFTFRLGRLLRQLRPSVVYSFLSTANLLAVLLKPVIPGTRLVWGLRASNMDLARYDWLARLTYRVEPALAVFSDRIIANSEAGRRHAAAQGFPEAKLFVVPNGIDTARFQHDEEGRRRVRAEWGVHDGERLVGLVARIDPMKDHPNFIKAASLVSRDHPEALFACIGGGAPEARRSLQSLASQLKPPPKVLWCGQRSDMPAVFSALDVACSASAFGEGFSNAVAEAMACGVPCAGTDVGDTASVIGDTGVIVPPSSPNELAVGIARLLSRQPSAFRELQFKARQRVIDLFSVEALVRRTRESWTNL